jgi:glycine cleavage system H lipoate-binding protein
MENSELIQYLDERFTRIENKLETKAEKADINKLYNVLDGYVKEVNDYSEDETMLSHKVNRHENWLLKIAEKVGIKLEY